MASNAAAAILAGLPGIQQAAQTKVEAGAAIGQGLANTGRIVRGILNARTEKQIEDDFATVDNAFTAAMAGNPEKMSSVLTAVAPTLKTAKGKAYLADKMGKTFGIKSDLLDIEVKKHGLLKRKQEPERVQLLNQLRDNASDPKATSTIMAKVQAMGDEAFFREAMGVVETTQSGRRAAESHDVEKKKAEQEEALKREAVKVEQQLKIMIGMNPALLRNSGEWMRIMNAAKVPSDVQDLVATKLSVWLEKDLKIDAADAAKKKAQIANWQTGANKVGKTLKFGPDGEPVMGEDGNPVMIDDVSSERWKKEQEDKSKAMSLRERAVALSERSAQRAEEAAAKGDRKAAFAETKDAQEAVRGYLRDAYDQWGGLKPGYDRDTAEAFKAKDAEYAKKMMELEKGVATPVKSGYSYKTVEEWTAAAKAVPPAEKEAFKAAYLAWKAEQK